MFHRIAILRLFVISQENTLKHLFTLFGTTSFQNTSGRQHLNRSDNLNKDILTPLLVTSHSKSMSLAKRHLLTFPPPCRTLSFIILSGTKTLVCNFQKKQRRIGNIDLVKRWSRQPQPPKNSSSHPNSPKIWFNKPHLLTSSKLLIYQVT